MINLDSIAELKKIDTKNVLGSIEKLHEQCIHAWNDASKIEVPDYYRDVKNIIMCGMGGSGLGARIIESVYSDNLKYPLIRVNNYDLPQYTDIHSLVVCSSYSGETEETLTNAAQAVSRMAKWIAIASGGTLIEMAKMHKIPYYKINPLYNPSKEPRMAIGYSVIGQIVLASKVGLIDLAQDEIKYMDNVMKKMTQDLDADVNEKENQAKVVARKMLGKIIIFISSDHLTGAMHTFNNQLNENAKNLSYDFTIPELNHHLMEGLKHPLTNPENVFIIIANSNLYSPKIKKRFAVTKEVIEKNNIPFYEFNCSSDTKLSQTFELIQFGAFVNFYLAMLFEQNPSPIPWVDYFKKRLAK